MMRPEIKSSGKMTVLGLSAQSLRGWQRAALLAVAMVSSMVGLARPLTATGLPCGSYQHLSWGAGQVTWNVDGAGHVEPTISDALETKRWEDPCANTQEPDQQTAVPYSEEDLLTLPDPNTGQWKYQVTYRAFSTAGGPDLVTTSEYALSLEPPGLPEIGNVTQTTLEATLPALPQNAVSLQLQQKLATERNQAFVDVGEPSPGGTLLEVSELSPDTDYTYRVIAIYPAGLAQGGMVGVTTATSAPEAPEEPDFDEIYDESLVVVAPELPARADYMNLEWRMVEDPEGPWTLKYDHVEGEERMPISDLMPGVSYQFRLVAVNSAGSSTGDDATATTLVPSIVWGQGTALQSPGIRWPLTNATISPGQEGVLEAHEAQDWDLMRQYLGGYLLREEEQSDACGYSWSATGGTFKNGINAGREVIWVAPQQPGTYQITLTVDDENGANQGNQETGSRNDASLSYDDAPLLFRINIVVE